MQQVSFIHSFIHRARPQNQQQQGKFNTAWLMLHILQAHSDSYCCCVPVKCYAYYLLFPLFVKCIECARSWFINLLHSTLTRERQYLMSKQCFLQMWLSSLNCFWTNCLQNLKFMASTCSVPAACLYVSLRDFHTDRETTSTSLSEWVGRKSASMTDYRTFVNCYLKFFFLRHFLKIEWLLLVHLDGSTGSQVSRLQRVN